MVTLVDSYSNTSQDENHPQDLGLACVERLGSQAEVMGKQFMII